MKKVLLVVDMHDRYYNRATYPKMDAISAFVARREYDIIIATNDVDKSGGLLVNFNLDNDEWEEFDKRVLRTIKIEATCIVDKVDNTCVNKKFLQILNVLCGGKPESIDIVGIDIFDNISKISEDLHKEGIKSNLIEEHILKFEEKLKRRNLDFSGHAFKEYLGLGEVVRK